MGSLFLQPAGGGKSFEGLYDAAVEDRGGRGKDVVSCFGFACAGLVWLMKVWVVMLLPV